MAFFFALVPAVVFFGVFPLYRLLNWFFFADGSGERFFVEDIGVELIA